MALILCSECGKEISSKAGACPQCGAPVSIDPINVSENQKKVKAKTQPLTWVVAVAIVCLAFWYLPKANRDANLLSMPVEIKTRSALTGPGLVLDVKNTSTRHLAFLVSLKNPTTRQERSYRLDAAPSQIVEIGHREGWTLSSGDVIKISNNEYRVWEGRVP
jgi:DNA-directed RNA polymerase subunit RPC12/RpoP